MLDTASRVRRNYTIFNESWLVFIVWWVVDSIFLLVTPSIYGATCIICCYLWHALRNLQAVFILLKLRLWLYFRQIYTLWTLILIRIYFMILCVSYSVIWSRSIWRWIPFWNSRSLSLLLLNLKDLFKVFRNNWISLVLHRVQDLRMISNLDCVSKRLVFYMVIWVLRYSRTSVSRKGRLKLLFLVESLFLTRWGWFLAHYIVVLGVRKL